METEAGILEPISEKIMHNLEIKSSETVPIAIQNLNIVGGLNPSCEEGGPTRNSSISNETAKNEVLNSLPVELLNSSEGEIFGQALSRVQVSLGEVCKDSNAGLHGESPIKEKPQTANLPQKDLTDECEEAKDEITRKDLLTETTFENEEKDVIMIVEETQTKDEEHNREIEIVSSEEAASKNGEVVGGSLEEENYIEVEREISNVNFDRLSASRDVVYMTEEKGKKGQDEVKEQTVDEANNEKHELFTSESHNMMQKTVGTSGIMENEPSNECKATNQGLHTAIIMDSPTKERQHSLMDDDQVPKSEDTVKEKVGIIVISQDRVPENFTHSLNDKIFEKTSDLVPMDEQSSESGSLNRDSSSVPGASEETGLKKNDTDNESFDALSSSGIQSPSDVPAIQKGENTDMETETEEIVDMSLASKFEGEDDILKSDFQGNESKEVNKPTIGGQTEETINAKENREMEISEDKLQVSYEISTEQVPQEDELTPSGNKPENHVIKEEKTDKEITNASSPTQLVEVHSPNEEKQSEKLEISSEVLYDKQKNCEKAVGLDAAEVQIMSEITKVNNSEERAQEDNKSYENIEQAASNLMSKYQNTSTNDLIEDIDTPKERNKENADENKDGQHVNHEFIERIEREGGKVQDYKSVFHHSCSTTEDMKATILHTLEADNITDKEDGALSTSQASLEDNRQKTTNPQDIVEHAYGGYDRNMDRTVEVVDKQGIHIREDQRSRQSTVLQDKQQDETTDETELQVKQMKAEKVDEQNKPTQTKLSFKTNVDSEICEGESIPEQNPESVSQKEKWEDKLVNTSDVVSDNSVTAIENASTRQEEIFQKSEVHVTLEQRVEGVITKDQIYNPNGGPEEETTNSEKDIEVCDQKEDMKLVTQSVSEGQSQEIGGEAEVTMIDKSNDNDHLNNMIPEINKPTKSIEISKAEDEDKQNKYNMDIIYNENIPETVGEKNEKCANSVCEEQIRQTTNIIENKELHDQKETTKSDEPEIIFELVPEDHNQVATGESELDKIETCEDNISNMVTNTTSFSVDTANAEEKDGEILNKNIGGVPDVHVLIPEIIEPTDGTEMSKAEDEDNQYKNIIYILDNQNMHETIGEKHENGADPMCEEQVRLVTNTEENKELDGQIERTKSDEFQISESVPEDQNEVKHESGNNNLSNTSHETTKSTDNIDTSKVKEGDLDKNHGDIPDVQDSVVKDVDYIGEKQKATPNSVCEGEAHHFTNKEDHKEFVHKENIDSDENDVSSRSVHEEQSQWMTSQPQATELGNSADETTLALVNINDDPEMVEVKGDNNLAKNTKDISDTQAMHAETIHSEFGEEQAQACKSLFEEKMPQTSDTEHNMDAGDKGNCESTELEVVSESMPKDQSQNTNGEAETNKIKSTLDNDFMYNMTTSLSISQAPIEEYTQKEKGVVLDAEINAFGSTEVKDEMESAKVNQEKTNDGENSGSSSDQKFDTSNVDIGECMDDADACFKKNIGTKKNKSDSEENLQNNIMDENKNEEINMIEKISDRVFEEASSKVSEEPEISAEILSDGSTKDADSLCSRVGIEDGRFQEDKGEDKLQAAAEESAHQNQRNETNEECYREQVVSNKQIKESEFVKLNQEENTCKGGGTSVTPSLSEFLDSSNKEQVHEGTDFDILTAENNPEKPEMKPGSLSEQERNAETRVTMDNQVDCKIYTSKEPFEEKTNRGASSEIIETVDKSEEIVNVARTNEESPSNKGDGLSTHNELAEGISDLEATKLETIEEPQNGVERSEIGDEEVPGKTETTDIGIQKYTKERTQHKENSDFVSDNLETAEISQNIEEKITEEEDVEAPEAGRVKDEMAQKQIQIPEIIEPTDDTEISKTKGNDNENKSTTHNVDSENIPETVGENHEEGAKSACEEQICHATNIEENKKFDGQKKMTKSDELVITSESIPEDNNQVTTSGSELDAIERGDDNVSILETTNIEEAIEVYDHKEEMKLVPYSLSEGQSREEMSCETEITGMDKSNDNYNINNMIPEIFEPTDNTEISKAEDEGNQNKSSVGIHDNQDMPETGDEKHDEGAKSVCEEYICQATYIEQNKEFDGQRDTTKSDDLEIISKSVPEDINQVMTSESELNKIEMGDDNLRNMIPETIKSNNDTETSNVKDEYNLDKNLGDIPDGQELVEQDVVGEKQEAIINSVQEEEAYHTNSKEDNKESDIHTENIDSAKSELSFISVPGEKSKWMTSQPQATKIGNSADDITMPEMENLNDDPETVTMKGEDDLAKNIIDISDTHSMNAERINKEFGEEQAHSSESLCEKPMPQTSNTEHRLDYSDKGNRENKELEVVSESMPMDQSHETSGEEETVKSKSKSKLDNDMMYCTATSLSNLQAPIEEYTQKERDLMLDDEINASRPTEVKDKMENAKTDEEKMIHEANSGSRSDQNFETSDVVIEEFTDDADSCLNKNVRSKKNELESEKRVERIIMDENRDKEINMKERTSKRILEEASNKVSAEPEISAEVLIAKQITAKEEATADVDSLSSGAGTFEGIFQEDMGEDKFEAASEGSAPQNQTNETNEECYKENVISNEKDVNTMMTIDDLPVTVASVDEAAPQSLHGDHTKSANDIDDTVHGGVSNKEIKESETVDLTEEENTGKGDDMSVTPLLSEFMDSSSNEQVHKDNDLDILKEENNPEKLEPAPASYQNQETNAETGVTMNEQVECTIYASKFPVEERTTIQAPSSEIIETVNKSEEIENVARTNEESPSKKGEGLSTGNELDERISDLEAKESHLQVEGKTTVDTQNSVERSDMGDEELPCESETMYTGLQIETKQCTQINENPDFVSDKLKIAETSQNVEEKITGEEDDKAPEAACVKDEMTQKQIQEDENENTKGKEIDAELEWAATEAIESGTSNHKVIVFDCTTSEQVFGIIGFTEKMETSSSYHEDPVKNIGASSVTTESAEDTKHGVGEELDKVSHSVDIAPHFEPKEFNPEAITQMDLESAKEDTYGTHGSTEVEKFESTYALDDVNVRDEEVMDTKLIESVIIENSPEKLETAPASLSGAQSQERNDETRVTMNDQVDCTIYAFKEPVEERTNKEQLSSEIIETVNKTEEIENVASTSGESPSKKDDGLSTDNELDGRISNLEGTKSSLGCTELDTDDEPQNRVNRSDTGDEEVPEKTETMDISIQKNPNQCTQLKENSDFVSDKIEIAEVSQNIEENIREEEDGEAPEASCVKDEMDQKKIQEDKNEPTTNKEVKAKLELDAIETIESSASNHVVEVSDCTPSEQVYDVIDLTEKMETSPSNHDEPVINIGVSSVMEAPMENTEQRVDEVLDEVSHSVDTAPHFEPKELNGEAIKQMDFEPAKEDIYGTHGSTKVEKFEDTSALNDVNVRDEEVRDTKLIESVAIENSPEKLKTAHASFSEDQCQERNDETGVTMNDQVDCAIYDSKETLEERTNKGTPLSEIIETVNKSGEIDNVARTNDESQSKKSEGLCTDDELDEGISDLEGTKSCLQVEVTKLETIGENQNSVERSDTGDEELPSKTEPTDIGLQKDTNRCNQLKENPDFLSDKLEIAETSQNIKKKIAEEEVEAPEAACVKDEMAQKQFHEDENEAMMNKEEEAGLELEEIETTESGTSNHKVKVSESTPLEQDFDVIGLTEKMENSPSNHDEDQVINIDVTAVMTVSAEDTKQEVDEELDKVSHSVDRTPHFDPKELNAEAINQMGLEPAKGDTNSTCGSTEVEKFEGDSALNDVNVKDDEVPDKKLIESVVTEASAGDTIEQEGIETLSETSTTIPMKQAENKDGSSVEDMKDEEHSHKIFTEQTVKMSPSEDDVPEHAIHEEVKYANSLHEENQQSDLNQLPVSRFLMAQILQEEGPMLDRGCGVTSEDKMQEKDANEQNGVSMPENEENLVSLPAKSVTSEASISKDKVEGQKEHKQVLDVMNEEWSHDVQEDKQNIAEKDDKSPENNLSEASPKFRVSEDKKKEESPGYQFGIENYVVKTYSMELTSIEKDGPGSKVVMEDTMNPALLLDRKIHAAVNEKVTGYALQKDNEILDRDVDTSSFNIVLGTDTSQEDHKGDTQIFQQEEKVENVSSVTAEEQIPSVSELTETRNLGQNEKTPQNVKYDQSEKVLESSIVEGLKPGESLKIDSEVNIEEIEVEKQHEISEGQMENMKNNLIKKPTGLDSENVHPHDHAVETTNKIAESFSEESNLGIDERQSKEATEAQVEGEITDEEKDEKEEETQESEHRTDDADQNAAIIVDGRDAKLKPAHKKHHNILSGVGSKVKHSIAKVKKAITGKSSHPKPVSPK